MPWSSPHPPPCPGRIGCRKRKNRKDMPLWKVAPIRARLPPPLEGDNISDVSMVDDSLLQHDSDMVIKEEREESMERDVLHDSNVPTPLKEKSMSEDFEAGDSDDHCSHTSEESTDENLPHDSDPDEDELLGPVTDISVPGGTF